MDCTKSLQPRLGAGGEGVPVDVLDLEDRVDRLRGGVVQGSPTRRAPSAAPRPSGRTAAGTPRRRIPRAQVVLATPASWTKSRCSLRASAGVFQPRSCGACCCVREQRPRVRRYPIATGRCRSESTGEGVRSCSCRCPVARGRAGGEVDLQPGVDNRTRSSHHATVGRPGDGI